MNQISEEDLSETNSVFKNDSQRIYNQTFPSNQIKEEKNKKREIARIKTVLRQKEMNAQIGRAHV